MLDDFRDRPSIWRRTTLAIGRRHRVDRRAQRTPIVIEMLNELVDRRATHAGFFAFRRARARPFTRLSGKPSPVISGCVGSTSKSKM